MVWPDHYVFFNKIWPSYDPKSMDNEIIEYMKWIVIRFTTCLLKRLPFHDHVLDLTISFANVAYRLLTSDLTGSYPIERVRSKLDDLFNASISLLSSLFNSYLLFLSKNRPTSSMMSVHQRKFTASDANKSKPIQ